ncbi:hypothetical protein IPG41_00755 [Candidatus Peregrinibacteria bacterium]|nr:MAG: hypothetical protein IPG41_00755 [Candidatus Peregrinibacteria bacterium]
MSNILKNNVNVNDQIDEVKAFLKRHGSFLEQLREIGFQIPPYPSTEESVQTFAGQLLKEVRTYWGESRPRVEKEVGCYPNFIHLMETYGQFFRGPKRNFADKDLRYTRLAEFYGFDDGLKKLFLAFCVDVQQLRFKPKIAKTARPRRILSSRMKVDNQVDTESVLPEGMPSKVDVDQVLRKTRDQLLLALNEINSAQIPLLGEDRDETMLEILNAKRQHILDAVANINRALNVAATVTPE